MYIHCVKRQKSKYEKKAFLVNTKNRENTTQEKNTQNFRVPQKKKNMYYYFYLVLVFLHLKKKVFHKRELERQSDYNISIKIRNKKKTSDISFHYQDVINICFSEKSVFFFHFFYLIKGHTAKYKISTSAKSNFNVFSACEA